jgi:hypothetical protein
VLVDGLVLKQRSLDRGPVPPSGVLDTPWFFQPGAPAGKLLIFLAQVTDPITGLTQKSNSIEAVVNQARRRLGGGRELGARRRRCLRPTRGAQASAFAGCAAGEPCALLFRRPPAAGCGDRSLCRPLRARSTGSACARRSTAVGSVLVLLIVLLAWGFLSGERWACAVSSEPVLVHLGTLRPLSSAWAIDLLGLAFVRGSHGTRSFGSNT